MATKMPATKLLGSVSKHEPYNYRKAGQMTRLSRLKDTLRPDQCPECEGYGETLHTSSIVGDPQCEYTMHCEKCDGTGYVPDWEPSESQQGLIPIPDGYNEQ